MFLTVLVTTGVIFVLFLIQRYRRHMAALVAWIVGSITGTNTEQKSTPDLPKSSNRKTKSSNSKPSSPKKLKSKRTEETSSGLQSEKPLEATVEQAVTKEASTTNQPESSPVTKYQTISVQETRRRSLDFDALLNKLEKIQEIKTEDKTEDSQATKQKIKKGTLGKAQKTVEEVEKGDTEEGWTVQERPKKKRSPKREEPEEDKTEIKTVIEKNIKSEVKREVRAGQEFTRTQSENPFAPKKEQTGKEKIHSSKEIRWAYKQTEILPQNIQSQSAKEPEKLVIANLAKSSIIEHYQNKTKQVITTNQTVQVGTSKDCPKLVTKKIEINIKSSNTIQNQPKPTLDDKNIVDNKTEFKNTSTTIQDQSHPLLDNKNIVNIQTESIKISNTVQDQPKLTLDNKNFVDNKTELKKTSNTIQDPSNSSLDNKNLVDNKTEFIKISNTIQDQPEPKLDDKKISDIQTKSTVPNTKIQTTKSSLKSKTIDLHSEPVIPNLPKQTTHIKASVMKTVTQVRVLTLNDNEHQDSIVYRIEKNWILQFRLGPSLLGRKVALYCNYPETKNGKAVEFNRNRYILLPWSQDEGCQNADDTALFTQITIKAAGSFHYYFVYENAKESGPQGSGFFLVDPVLDYGNKEELPLNCIQCQTVLSKCLGSLSSWENKLRVAKESGYNMIHFTPIQELGESNSAYSLSGQLKLNPTFSDGNKKITFSDVEKLTVKMRTEWKVLSICDIVLNHTANETDWLEEHPEATYNCLNCPYMRPAYLLDAALHHFSGEVKNGFYETWGIPPVVCTEDHLNAIRHVLHTKVLAEINISEMFICDATKLVSVFLDRARKIPPESDSKKPEHKLKLIRDPLYRRMAATVDMELALKLYNVFRSGAFDEESRLKRCGEEFKITLDQLNKEITDELNVHLSAAVENSIAGIRYFRVQHDGPQIKEISLKNPLSFRYFTDYGKPKSVKEYEEVLYGPNSKHLMAHNGWVMNADPMRNFADPDSNVYVRRELIAWGDSVKLRYGDKPEDCPFLWNHMKAYVELTAKIFDGVRLDNCHSTPIPVAEYLLDCARRVRPDLYVVAELFTNSDHTDNIFVNRLGITSLIREAMSAWDSHEEGRLVYRYGGDPVGAFFQPHVRPLVPSIAHALFLDLTHDNPSPVEKRSVFDLLTSAALVNMACCASGSSRGYDELVNHHIHVVDESRHYTEWTNDEASAAGNPRYVSYKSGIVSAKRAINDLHFKLGADGFNQVYVDQIDPDIVAVTRHRPETHQSVILVAFTAFGHPNLDSGKHQRGIKPLRVEGVLDEIILEATLNHKGVEKGGPKFAHPQDFVKDGKWINGLSEYEVDIKQHIQLVNSDVFELADSGTPNVTQLNFTNFKPGSVVAIKVSLPKNVQQSIHKLRELLLSFARTENADLSDVIGRLNLADLNRALYRCNEEENDDGKGFGAYHIPNFGSLVYCGFQGFMSLLSNIRPSNDLGHPMCGNLRDGNWMIDYISQRLKVDDGTKELGQWLEKNTQPLRDIPRYLIPSYFDVIVTGIYIQLIEQAYSLMSDFVKNGSTFVKGLSLGSLQFGAVMKSAELPTLSPSLSPPKPPTRQNDQGKTVQACVTVSAGLPHFSTGYMRNWGRDTFIALRGLYILTGRFQDARFHILGYAACLRHGLIPNLLDGGRNSRFNCRDAVWWWLYCIKTYVEEAPKGIELLSDKVSRIFPTDDSPALEPGVEDQALYEVMQEALKIHFQGLAFRERNAGRQIDAHMSDRGFNNQIGVHPESGFVFGGNEANCGTWMDKMGSSDKATNRGKPATPRDGSAIELVGLSKAVVTWLSQLYQQKQYPYQGVERASKNGGLIKWTFKQWAEKIQNSFEQHFWVNAAPTPGESQADLINKRGIYKDSFGASQAWADFQLRCNFPIAMVAAPEMFNPKHAWIALQQAEKHLLGPLGIKTLDPDDWAYCGDYNNADDSSNLKTANGFNYHQGPEWLWPVGYYLRARLHFAAANGELARTVANTKVVLAKHFTELQTSLWRGLPELTNSNGSYCHDSSRTQAWSMSCILEVLYDLQKIESKQSMLN